ncbi:MAG: hypothetical protein KGO50_03260 [Myxococcales bacterium]|nr:hypothetical protein [Myxococcales bacterium]
MHMPHRIFALLVVPSLLLLTTFTQQAPEAQQTTVIEVEYRGEMIDADGHPISGTFPLTFQLFTTPDGTEPVWTEQRFVTVDQGGYRIRLGRATPLPANLAGQAMTLAIVLGSSGEIARYPFTPAPWSAAPDPLQTARIERITFAELAGRAVRADRALFAQDCRTLGGRTIDQLDRSPDLAERIEELRTQLRDEGGAQIGSDYQYAEIVGHATNGNRYDVVCPAGYVITGARGGAGNLVDGLQMVCTQIQ